MKCSWFVLLFATLGSFAVAADSPALADLQPLLAQPGKIVLQNDFSKSGPVDRETWGPRQGTQWKIEDGVLRGRPSTPASREGKKNHLGLEPRVSAPGTPAQFIARFSVRFTEGEATAVSPFVEFGHHVCRLRLGKEGAELLVDGESLKMGESTALKYEPGRWYHMLAELKGNEFVLQVAGGPVFHATHDCLAKPNPSGGNGLGIAGPKEGMVEIDNVTLWNVLPQPQPGWAATQAKLPKFEPVPATKAKAGKAKAGGASEE